MTKLDRAINNDMLVVSKSLLPYLNMDHQRPMAIFIKVMELIYTVNLFSNEASVRSLSRSHESGWEKSFLNDVKSNLNDDKAYFIDAIMKLAEAKEMLTGSQSATRVSPASQEPEYHLHPMDSGVLETMPFPEQETPPTPPLTMHAKKTTPPSGPSPEQLINGLSSMLDPNQAQLLKVISSLFTSSQNSPKQ